MAQAAVARYDHRHRDIMSLTAIEYCRQQGCTTLGDNQDMREAPNVALDFVMGFERLPAWIMLERRIGL